MPNYLQRIITAVVLLLFMGAALFINQYVFLVCMSFLCCMGLYELASMFQKGGTIVNKPVLILSGLSIFVLSHFIAKGALEPKFLVLSVVPIAFMMVTELFNPNNDFSKSISVHSLALIYIVVTFCLMNQIVYLDGSFNSFFIFMIVAITAASDSGAYIVGVNIGKRPLAKTISPKKSIEGFIGGVIASIGVAYLFSYYSTDFTAIQMMILGAIISIVGTIGDLVESRLKRSLNVKDSSNLLPGHGGFLDRFDSLIFSTAFVYLVVIFL